MTDEPDTPYENAPSDSNGHEQHDDICGDETASGSPCQLPPSRSDGKCHNHTDVEEERARGGRPTKLTMGRQENIAQTIERGQSMNAAARANGINTATLYEWLQQGEADKTAGRDDTPHAEFHDRIMRARGESERLYVEQLRRMATDNDDAAMLMTMLKQRHPDSWGDANASEQKASVNVYLGSDETTEIDPETLEVQAPDGDGDGDEEADAAEPPASVDATPPTESDSDE